MSSNNDAIALSGAKSKYTLIEVAEKHRIERDARRYKYLAADGDRARRILNEFSGLDVEVEIDRGMAEEDARGENK